MDIIGSQGRAFQTYDSDPDSIVFSPFNCIDSEGHKRYSHFLIYILDHSQNNKERFIFGKGVLGEGATVNLSGFTAYL